MLRLRTPFLALATSAALVALAGCSTTVDEPVGSAGTAAPSDAPDRVVTTDQGDVTIPGDPQRVVVLNSALAGSLFALDVPVHATIPEVPGPGGGDYPESWAKDAEADGTVILPWGEDGFDYEAILAEEPDLIVGGGQGFPAFQATQAYEQLTEIAPTVIVSNTLLTWQDQLSFLAEDVFDAADKEKDLVAAYESRVAEVAAAIELPPTPVAYVVLTSDGTPYSLPETSALPQTLAAVGLEPSPVIADNPGFEAFGTGDSFEISTEQVSQVFTAPTVFTFTFNAPSGDVATLAQNPVYAALPAFASGNAYDLPHWAYRADYVRTMELLDVVEDMFTPAAG
ncbi:ABC transporter substrate-binding protein [Oerskovia enterophila]|uniref:Ferrienterobactin-binding periplasmic protein n=1 Tax=Oerskovia enterophila TaxID=43678 RepID=A0A163PYZ0_9CELL|nr:ABC transporter substrate-binding protein [Oerskovia enterophila]KZM33650.1 ferrienterobactin-binding periplasmic protein precursor [Oerskovia enterophila]OCI32265.1 ferrienterobactin-binding periplasmic protein precursor [Oerskovia enterophila]